MFVNRNKINFHGDHSMANLRKFQLKRLMTIHIHKMGGMCNTVATEQNPVRIILVLVEVRKHRDRPRLR